MMYRYVLTRKSVALVEAFQYDDDFYSKLLSQLVISGLSLLYRSLQTRTTFDFVQNPCNPKGRVTCLLAFFSAPDPFDTSVSSMLVENLIEAFLSFLKVR